MVDGTEYELPHRDYVWFTPALRTGAGESVDAAKSGGGKAEAPTATGKSDGAEGERGASRPAAASSTGTIERTDIKPRPSHATNGRPDHSGGGRVFASPLARKVAE